MKTEKVITILAEKKKRFGERKGPVRAASVKKPLARRRNTPFLRFYDLAQVNHQPIGNDPVWEDHPILYTATYTTTVTGIGVAYNIDPMPASIYDDYTDMMFSYPVTEWKDRYRLVAGSSDDTLGPQSSHDYGFDARITLNDTGTYPDIADETIGNHRIFSTNQNYNSVRAARLADPGWVWGKRNVEYRGLDRLDICTANQAAFFGLSTGDKTKYKVTTTNNPSAADVGVLVPSGIVDIFLMPQIILFFCTSNGPRTEVLGPWYQVAPRKLWPRYINLGFDTFPYGTDAEKNAFIEYQQSRSGAQASYWDSLGVGSISADEWSKQNSWGCSTIANFQDDPYFGRVWRSLTLFENTFVRSTGAAPFFVNSNPFLTAVILMGGQYYYVWDISTPDGNGRNYSAIQSGTQFRRFRIDVDVNWNGAVVDPNPPKPADGTGTDADEFS